MCSDRKEVAKWYKKAAENGNTEDQSALGDLYENEIIDYQEAVK